MQIYKIDEIEDRLEELKNQEFRGVRTSFKTWGDKLTYVKGTHCIIIASPSSGKTQWTLQQCIDLAISDGWCSVIFTPESGTVAQILAILIHIYTGKTLYESKITPKIEEYELTEALGFLKKHFYIVDSEASFTLNELMDAVSQMIEAGFKVDNIMIDNLNDLKEDFGEYNRQDIAVEQDLSKLARFNKKHNLYSFLLTHTANQGLPQKGVGNNGETIMYYNPPMPQEARSGQSLFRKAYLMLSIWRCPYGLNDPVTGEPFKENQSIVTVLKAKPQQAAERGARFNMYYNKSNNRLYDIQVPFLNKPVTTLF